MACKEGQLNIVELMVNDFQYQFECSTFEWNDSFCFSRTQIHICTVIIYSRVQTELQKCN